MAGGNALLDVLTGSAQGGDQSPTPAPAVASGSALSGSLGAGTIANTAGTSTSVGRVQFAIGGLFLVAVVALVLLNRAGFRFSLTVG